MATRIKEPSHAVAVGLPAPIGRLKPKLAKELELLCREKVTLPAQSIGADVPFMGITELPTGPISGRTPRGTWFYGTDFAEDPARDWRGRIPIPSTELRRLQVIRDGGVQFDCMFVVHEVPAEWEPGSPLPELVPKPPAVRRADDALTRTSIAAADIARSIPGAVASAVSQLSLPAPQPTRVTYYGGEEHGYDYDPVILGGVALPDGSGVAWFKVAQWEWR